MSTSAANETADMSKNQESVADILGEISSVDSSSDSGASSRSRSSSGSSKSGNQGAESKMIVTDKSGSSSSDDGECESSSTEKSVDSYKSLNTTMAKTPAKLEVINVEVVNDEVKAKGASPKLSVNIEVASDAKSPVPVTPAKSLKLGESPINAGQNSTNTVSKREGPGETEKKDLSTVAVVESAPTDKTDKPVAVERKANKNKKATKTEVTKDQPESPKIKHLKKEKEKKQKATVHKSKSVEEVEEQVRKLQQQLDKVCKKSEARSSSNKRKAKSEKSAKQSKKARRQSSDDGESQSSLSGSPCTSSRIKKIPEGRKYQRVAMSRGKQFGVIREGKIHVTEVVDALKTIDKTKFIVEPSHAYRKFKRVPGTGLPHIVGYITDFKRRYGEAVQSIAKLNLILARDLEYAKKSMIGPEAENEYALLWQFANDLNQAVATSEQGDAVGSSKALESVDKGKSAKSGGMKGEQPADKKTSVSETSKVDPGVKTSATKKKKKKHSEQGDESRDD